MSPAKLFEKIIAQDQSDVRSQVMSTAASGTGALTGLRTRTSTKMFSTDNQVRSAASSAGSASAGWRHTVGMLLYPLLSAKCAH